MKKVKLLKNVENYGKKGQIIIKSNTHSDFLLRKGCAELVEDLNNKIIVKCPRCKQKLLRPEGYCANQRPPRKIFCQLKKGHKGSHRAIIFWEDD